jgi:flagellin
VATGHQRNPDQGWPDHLRFNFTATSTVRDVVNEINKSGIATASVDDDGKLNVTGTGSDTSHGPAGTATTPPALLRQLPATTPEQPFGLPPTANTDAGGSGTSAVRSNLIKQFNDLRDQIDQLAKDAGFNGTNLLGGDKLSIIFNEKTGSNQNKLDIQGDTVTSAISASARRRFLGTQLTGDFAVQNDTDARQGRRRPDRHADLAALASSTLGSNLSVVQTRQDFTKELVNTLTIGADNLVSADSNAEGASLLALNTRQQLSQTALSLANQADQGVLRLFQ